MNICYEDLYEKNHKTDRMQRIGTDDGIFAGFGAAPQRPADISFFLTANILTPKSEDLFYEKC